jgi:hypothetical protein
VFLRSFRRIARQADLDLESFSDLPGDAPRGKGE